MNLAQAKRIRSQNQGRGLMPDPLLDLDEWADRYRMLSTKTSAEPGQWRTDRTPYLRDIMKCLSQANPIQKVIFMKGSQIGGTEVGNCWIGYIIDQSPSPTMVIQPTDGLAKRYSKQRVDPMIAETPKLIGRVVSKRAKEGTNTTHMKEFDGGFLVVGGAKTAAGLKSIPIRNLFLDEVDSYEEDVEGEGDPVDLAEARTRTFARRKIFKNGTPTIQNRSRIEAEYLRTDQRKYYVPCPECEHYQTITWSKIKWPKGEPHKAEMQCEKCGTMIAEYRKTEMLLRGEWRATVENHSNEKIVGFHVSSLYSPVGWFSWADAAQQFIDAGKDPLKLMVFVNTVLGETWKEQGDAPDWEDIYRRREGYKIGTVPDGVLFLTAGADVQKDRIEVEIVGWGRDLQSWSIDYIEILGDTSTPEPYSQLESLLDEKFPFAANGDVKLPIKVLAIDSGYNTQSVYNWARNHIGRVIPVKGTATQPLIISGGRPVDVTYKGQTYRRGVKLWTVGTNLAKTELYGWLRVKAPLEKTDHYKPGYCHFPEYQEEYFRMLTSEQLQIRRVRGHPVYEWHKVYERNESLDARIYARAAASVVGLDRFESHNWDEFEQVLADLKQNVEPHKPRGDTPTKGGIPVRRSKFWGG